MRKLLFSSLTALLAASAIPAAAEDIAAANARGEQASQAPRQRADPSGERRICVREAGSESRIRRRICRTAQEWRDLHGDEINDPR
jgi:hypothetical protein